METLKNITVNTNEQNWKEKVFEELVNPHKNLKTKTEINFPLKYAQLEVLANFAIANKCSIFGNILKEFAEESYILHISHNREGRKEFVKMVENNLNTNEMEIPHGINPIK